MKVGIQLSFYLGQRVACNGRPGRLFALTIENDVIMGTVELDEPIVFPSNPELGIREFKAWTQHVPVLELTAL